MTLIGYTGKPVEQKYTPGGTAVARVSVATSKRFKKGEEWESVTRDIKEGDLAGNFGGRHGVRTHAYRSRSIDLLFADRLLILAVLQLTFDQHPSLNAANAAAGLVNAQNVELLAFTRLSG